MNNLSPISWAVRPLRYYATFSGRASRAEFWWFFLFTMIIYFAGAFALGATGAGLASMNPGGALATGAFGIGVAFIGLFWLALFIPMLAVQFRRLHDTDRSGWWIGGFWLLYLIYMGAAFGMVSLAAAAGGPGPGMMTFLAITVIALVTFVYSIVLLVFFCLPGTNGQNRYGGDPYGEDVAEVFA